MSPAAAKAAMGTMACWRTVRASEALGAVACFCVIPWDSCVFEAAWLSAVIKPRLRATASSPARRRFMCCITGVVLLIGDFLHPCNVLAVHRTGDRQVGHRGGGRGAVPVLDARRAPDHVAGTDFLHGLAPFLGEPHARYHHQALP